MKEPNVDMPGPDTGHRKDPRETFISYFASSIQLKGGEYIREGTVTGRLREWWKILNWELGNLGSLSTSIWLCCPQTSICTFGALPLPKGKECGDHISTLMFQDCTAAGPQLVGA